MTSSMANRPKLADRPLVHTLKNICVYCGSNPGALPDYRAAALDLADLLVKEDIGLVYGGSSKGIMGAIADRVLEQGGRVVGVIPQSLVAKEVAHSGLTEQHVVDSMHERKSLMAEKADAFIAMPGGTGTLEEIIETLTWAQLQFHAKPCGLLNTNNYFRHLIAHLDYAVEQEFLRVAHRNILMADADPASLLTKFREYEPPLVEKWVE